MKAEALVAHEAKKQHGFSEKNLVQFLDHLVRKVSKDPASIGMSAEAFHKLYPRIYPDLGGYYSPKLLAVTLLMSAREVEKRGYNGAPLAQRLIYPSLSYLIEHRMPLLFIAPNLLEAVQRSDFQDDIDWVNLKLPYEHGVLMLPRQGLAHPKSGNVAFILWSRLQKEQLQPPPFPSGIPSVSTDTRFSLIAFCPEACMWYDSNLTASYRPTLKLNNLFYRGDSDPFPCIRTDNPLDEDLSEEDANFVEKVGCTVFGTFLALNARPELLTKAVRHNVIGAVGSPNRREFWSPNIIGRNYRPSQQQPPAGTHASPRLHWRRGHFRNQPFGPKTEPQHKTIWIEPMLVGVGKEVA